EDGIRDFHVTGVQTCALPIFGTLSPENMTSREDGSLITATLWNAESISAEFNRYTSRDPLCCPSQKSSVTYTITNNKLKASEVKIGRASCREREQIREEKT